MGPNALNHEDAEFHRPDSDRKWPSFLASWSRRRGTESGVERNKDDQEEELTLPERFRRMFSSLFRKNVEQPTEVQLADDESTDRQGLGFGRYLFDREAQLDVPTSDTHEAHAGSAEHESREVNTDLPESDPEVSATNEVPAAESQEVPYDLYYEDLPTTQYADRSEHPVTAPERNSGNQQEEWIRPRIIERREGNGLALAALGAAGAEALARRRADKRIERQVKREAREIRREAEHASEEQKQINDQLQKKVLEQRNRQEREALLVKRPVVEQVKQSSTKPEIRPQSFEAPERQVFEQSEARPEKAVQQPKSPEKVLERVVEAVEHDEPIERAYERRQEVKDEQQLFSSPTAATAVNKVIADNKSLQSFVNTQQQSTQVSGSLDGSQDFQSPEYQSAMRSGFAAGLIIAGLFLVVYFFTR